MLIATASCDLNTSVHGWLRVHSLSFVGRCLLPQRLGVRPNLDLLSPKEGVHSHPKPWVRDVMTAVGDGRKVAALQFVLSLGPCLHPGQACLDGVFDGCIITQLKVQPLHRVAQRTPPVSAVQGVCTQSRPKSATLSSVRHQPVHSVLHAHSHLTSRHDWHCCWTHAGNRPKHGAPFPFPIQTSAD